MTNVVMPQMGESIAEGTIVRWIKKVGDTVDRDEPLFEISTDKVDAEIPAPAAGVLTEIKVKEGETVPVDSVVAVIGQAGETATAPAEPAMPAAQHPASAAARRDEVAERAAETPAASGKGAVASQADGGDSGGGEREGRSAETASSGELSREDLRRQKSSPLVRKIAREHNVDISRIQGSGVSGRVTKQDILGYIGSGAEAPARAAPAGQASSTQAPSRETPVFQPGERVQIVPMTIMRRKIAEHMIMSRRTSAHVHSVFEIDFARVAKIRDAKKSEYERLGAKLTYMAFIAKAVIDALRAVPVVNSSIDGDNVVYKKDVNLGIAVALDWGLIVPVIKNADEKSILGLSRAIADVAERARAKQLKPDEVHGGTFTITNPGVFGAQFGMPIINQPQVAILGVGTVEKRPVVVDDAIAIRPRAYLTLGYDHRIIDGAVADQFMSMIKKQLENFDAAAL